MLNQRRILVGVGGGIAAYKVCEVVSTLAKAGAAVRVILTQSAQQFMTPLTLATLSRHPAYTDADFWEPVHGRPLHIELGEWAEVMLMAPLTANTLGKIVGGLADNLLLNTLLASTCPVLLAPAMNTDMWQQPAVQRNWQQLQAESRFHAAGPGAGVLACDRVGSGRMAEPAVLVAHLSSLLYTRGDRDLSGRHLLISAGSTREHLDPVRFIGNPATGKMGVALAQAAQHRGAAVTLVHGPLDEALLSGLEAVQRVPIVSAAQLQQALQAHAPAADWIVMAAAVADVTPAAYAATKLPKADLPDALPLLPVPDLIAELSQHRQPQQRLIGFAAQTGDIVTPAKAKLVQKRLDAIAANPIDQPDSGFGSDQNQAVLLDRFGRQQAVPPCSKLEMAHRLYDFVQTMPAAATDWAGD